ncbi:hypothetical protein SY88_11070 [Clostridiales bacterium PH28_bin88]|nr:hypothetical protein SY88_11070 [Clostridiales bacterium PH28_bin88]
MRQVQKSLLFLLLLAGIFLVAGCGQKKDAVATVNGEAITKTQLAERVSEMKAYAKSQGFDLDSPTHAPLLKEVETDALEGLIQEALFRQAAKDKGVKVSDQQVDEQLKLMKGGMTDQQFQEALKAQNMTEAKLKERLRIVLLQDALYKKVTEGIKVESAQVQDYFNEFKDSLVKMKVSHILFLAQEGEATEAQLAEAKAKAEAVIKQLKEGADFAALAKEKSEDEGSSKEGGLLDYYFTREDPYFVPEFVAGAFELEKGAFSQEPVKSPFGYHVIKAEDKKESFEELKDEIEATLLAEEKNKRFGEYYTQLESNAKIVKNLPEEPKESEAPKEGTDDKGSKDSTEEKKN